jgi:hypothetical protein
MDLINLDEIWNSPVDLILRMKSSNEFKVGETYKNLELCWYVFEENYKDLRESITSTTFSDAKELDLVLKRFSRLLHNFLAAAMMLRDVTRALKAGESQEFKEDYQEEVNLRFVDNHLNLFVENLRNYSLHYRLPIGGIMAEFKADPQTGNLFLGDSFFYLDKNLLEKWCKWGKGKVYLATADENIKIIDLIDAYFISIMDFQWWLHKYYSDAHRAELERISLVNTRIFELMNKPK